MIPCQRALFDIPEDVAYLNCAYMGPLTRAALAAGEVGLWRKARPWGISPADFFDGAERARTLFARLLHADPEGVALAPSASYGLAVAARNLAPAPGRRVVTLRDQFPSNVYCWMRTGAEVVAVDATGDDPTAAVLAAIDGRCAVAALPQVLWTTGALIDLERVAARCREAGAALALDLTQSAGAMPLDLGAIDPDFAVAAAYKWLLGPYATGFLYVAPRWRGGETLEDTWLGRAGSEDFARLVDYRADFQPGARRFDMGERANFALMPALVAALEHLLDWTPEAIGATLGAMTAAIADDLAPLGLRAPPPGARGPHYLSLALPPGAPADLVARLAARDVHVSRRGTSLRITPHLYNNGADRARLTAALAETLGA